MSFMETNYWWTHSLIGCATSPCQSHQKQDTHGRTICKSHSPHQSKFDTAAAGFAVKVHSIQQSSHSLMRRHSHAAAGPTSIGFARSQLALFFLPTLAHPVTTKLLWVQIYLGEDVPLYLMRMVNGHADNNVGSERIKDLQFRSNLPASSSLSY